MENKFKHFCTLPFWGGDYSHGKFSKHCCLFKKQYPEYNIDQIRQMHLEDRAAPECEDCYARERNGLPSNRQTALSEALTTFNLDIESIFELCKQPPYHPQFLKIYNSNTCNLACVTCSDYLSSAWGKLTGNQIRLHPITFTDEEITHWKYVLFLGGEPLLDKGCIDLLDRIYKLNKECYVNFSTNGTVMNRAILDSLSRFPNLAVSISVDGVGPHFEYLRYGGKWEVLESNVQQLKKISKHVGIGIAVSNLNVLFYDKIEQWAKTYGIYTAPNIVHSPDWLSSSNVPLAIRNKFPQAQKFFLNEFSPELFEKFKVEIVKQDMLKGISIKDYMPELYEMYWDPSLTNP